MQIEGDDPSDPEAASELIMKDVYVTAVTALGGRSGYASSSDGRLKVELSTPAALDGDDGPGTNPEQLLAAAHASSLLAAIRQVAEDRAIRVPSDCNVTATVELQDGRDGMSLIVTLDADIPCLSEADACDIVRQAMSICPLVRTTGEHVRTLPLAA
ncbi:Ohr family peroxiredoxin [Sphingomonas sp. BK235]|uniref:Ohr family peroxiredoxin n=1 Tax=Sphingomonas sp. BK235 TaxID=2512131 RepID=UPI001404B355|nr:Ohr family peroxiredoxin [Sphingomonas sp. BK235]